MVMIFDLSKDYIPWVLSRDPKSQD